MKIDCGLTYQEKQALKSEWHKWFSWYPVRLGYRDCRWLETIERTRISSWCSWEYRSIEEPKYLGAK